MVAIEADHAGDFRLAAVLTACNRKRTVLTQSAFLLVQVAAAIVSASCASSVFAAGPLPQGGHFSAGLGSIDTRATSIRVSQTSSRGVIDWSSFSIASGNRVVVDNGSGATLNRVAGRSISSIDGTLSATGSVYLINPQGVVVGLRGVVSTGGRFVASTLAVDANAFMAGDDLTLKAIGNGVVLNLGKISSSGGDVFLISRNRVENRGEIDAPKGTVELAAGRRVLLHDNTGGPQVFVQSGSHGSVYNSGTIKAAQISLQAADGNVFALAGRHSELRATGTAVRDGRVWLVADGGTVHAHGAVVAANADGSGGTVDMNGAAFHFDNVAIDAAQWNLTTPAYTAGPLNAAVLAQVLSGGTSVKIDTTAATGDINMVSTLRWTGGASLTLDARRTIHIGPMTTIGSTGMGNLTLRADSKGSNNGGSVINRGTIDWSHGTGVVAALYDSNGAYRAGTVKRNAAWTPAPFSGLRSQFTAYELVNSRADLENVSNHLSGVYALGKDIDFSVSTDEFRGIGGPANAAFTGQFDGMGHVISNVILRATEDAQTNPGLFNAIGTTGVVRNVSVENAYSNAAVPGPVGILAGLNQGLISNSHTSGAAQQAFAGPAAAGLVGQNDGTIERSSSSVDVGGADASAGLAVINNGLIIQSFSTGGAGGGGRSSAGGLVSTNNGTITQSYWTGGSAATDVGGIARDNQGSISESFAASAAVSHTFPQVVGGIASNNDGTIANDVFWDAQISGATEGVLRGTSVPVANGLTTAQMSMASSFGPTWDFSPAGTWVIPEGGTHPILRWQEIGH